jgi:hypothetical protein
MNMAVWLLFTYKVPNEPSARRVYVWRKLKALGALLLHDAVWVLPQTSRTREKLQWLATEVKDMEGGDASVWEAQQVFTGQDDDLRQHFIQQVDIVYRDLLQQLEKTDADLNLISKQFLQVQQQDYFQSELGQQVRELLLKRRGEDL